MRKILITISLLYLISCKSSIQSYEKEFYEKISNIKIPDNYKVLENIDNGEFVTGTVFQIDSLTIEYFAKTNGFDTIAISMYNEPLHFSKNYFLKYKPALNKTDIVLIKNGVKGKNSWEYVIDLKKKSALGRNTIS